MHVKTDFPYAIREIENTWIPLSDGARLAARIWLPEDAETNPVPALLEYLPYRKDDGTAIRDALRQPYFAGHGYAVLRVDMRGSGDADGFLADEYLPQEQEDALEVLAWIADQPWCNGNVGMMGISWGGFNSLQIAARRPPQLKAIMAMDATDDRYSDDVHYMGGCVLASQMLTWAAVMFAYNAAPPDPRHVGERWREMWFERMEKAPPFIETWLSHQRRDDYWKQGSVCEDYGAIEVPVYLVGGWADSYNNFVPRLLANLNGPRKALIGPWSHSFPESGVPGPAIGFLQESLRWWDTWLKGIDTGIIDEPMLRSWVQESVPPAVFHAERPGRWVADPSWPSPNVSTQTYSLNSDGAANTLDETAAPERQLDIVGVQSHGVEWGEWGAYGSPGEFPGDQRAADGQAITFTSAPLTEAVDILGRPEVILTLAADQPMALVAVRLCDVAPDGASSLVTWGLLNLTHRESHEQPTRLVPGRRYTVTVPLNMMGYRMPAGHRWRMAISPTCWRHAWPSPRPITLSLFTGKGSQLRLPVRTPQAEDEQLPPFGPPETAPPLPLETLRTGSHQQFIRQDVIGGVTELKTIWDNGHVRYTNTGMETESTSVETFTIREGDPLSAANRVRKTLAYKRGNWYVRVETDSHMTADTSHFHVSNHLDAYEGNTRVFTKSWTCRIPRDRV
ncbi:MAG TPA: CocE/NonD family hydrolase [Anaerolineae bacterium]